ncbi:MAG: hypothetical protein QXP53_00545 [Candidatus Pacearchaeota archaeon]
MLKQNNNKNHCLERFVQELENLGFETNFNKDVTFDHLINFINEKIKYPSLKHFLLYEIVWIRNLLIEKEKKYSSRFMLRFVNSIERYSLNKEYAKKYIYGKKISPENRKWVENFLIKLREDKNKVKYKKLSNINWKYL